MGSSDSLDGFKFVLGEALLRHLKVRKKCYIDSHKLHTDRDTDREQTEKPNKEATLIGIPKECHGGERANMSMIP